MFSYIGPSDSRLSGTVLRLRKASQGVGIDPIIEFQRKCTSRFIPPVHLPHLESVSLEKAWVESLTTLHDFSRPVERRSKDSIDIARREGVLATDLVGGDWIAVEIKVIYLLLSRYDY